jgi:hypothetical protein
MLSDTDVACVAIALALCLKKEKNRRSTKELYKRRPQYSHENLMTDLMFSEPYYIFFMAIRRSIISRATQDCCYLYNR